MLVHFVEPQWSDEYKNLDYDNYKVLSARTIESYDQFIKFIQAMVGHEVIINKEWYIVDTYAFEFPMGTDTLPCLKVFVYEAY